MNRTDLPAIWKSVIAFVKKNAVMCIAFLAAVITSFIIPIDKAYADYFDYKTLTCLFCVFLYFRADCFKIFTLCNI